MIYIYTVYIKLNSTCIYNYIYIFTYKLGIPFFLVDISSFHDISDGFHDPDQAALFDGGSTILHIRAREIFDSRGNPTVEVCLGSEMG